MIAFIQLNNRFSYWEQKIFILDCFIQEKIYFLKTWVCSLTNIGDKVVAKARLEEKFFEENYNKKINVIILFWKNVN